MKRSLRPTLAALVLPAALAVPIPLAAQAQWLPPTQGAAYAVEYVYPHLPEESGTRPGMDSPWVQGGVFLSGAVPLTRTVRAMVELPVGVAIGRDDACVDASCPAFHHAAFLGNPYVGIELALAGPTVLWTAGVRPPLQSVGFDEGGYYDRVAMLPALYAARNDRQQAFIPGRTSVRTGIEVRPRLAAGTELRLHAGALLAHDSEVPSSSTRKNTVEWRGGAQLWHTSGPLEVGAGVSALNLPVYVDERTTTYEWGVAAGLRLGPWLPLVQLRIPSRIPGGSRADWYNLGVAVQYSPR